MRAQRAIKRGPLWEIAAYLGRGLNKGNKSAGMSFKRSVVAPLGPGFAVLVSHKIRIKNDISFSIL